MLTDIELGEFLKSRAIEYEILKHGHSYRADEASRELGIDIREIVKSVLFITAEGTAVLVIVRGDRRVEQTKLAHELGTRKLRLASKEEVARITGYEAGTLPPVGHKNAIKTLIDNAVQAEKFVYAGGGTIGASLKIRVSDIIFLQNAKFTECMY
ncbi:MAG: YbaK/EbsC family protein [Nitrososphaerota archaeon]|nr:YbaK/EbsC family protein [Nitrososphaerota archaeon]MDG6929880.1 YbaK/EbsC family protein [Nitrososphaerota archaeon]